MSTKKIYKLKVNGQMDGLDIKMKYIYGKKKYRTKNVKDKKKEKEK